MTMRRLPPELAADMFKEDPASVKILLIDLCHAFGMHPTELLKELQGGRLVASFASDKPAFRYRDFLKALNDDRVFVTGQDLMAWMALTGAKFHDKKKDN